VGPAVGFAPLSARPIPLERRVTVAVEPGPAAEVVADADAPASSSSRGARSP
jgi:hypothetical protein